ncbi:EF hand [Cognatiyoonia koreensis]|uniref:EF hand n=1 Tax=Cognatiyoonia koreensis TaxID=364200 RepID=A0A1I0NTR8_9RHOB|nr:hypothetical protein [Cognatiyoonia koreensis]SEW04965.1 EF hand [Cognatiyoonia koreensis]
MPKTYLTALLTSTALIVAAPAIAEEDWDSDGDGGYSSTEFNAGNSAAGMFKEWDSDGDGMLSEDEFNAGNFAKYDANGDGVIDGDERDDLDQDFEDEDDDEDDD